MSATTLAVTDAIREYLLAVTVREPPLLARLREETQRLPDGGMQISPEQGRFMAFLVELCGVRRYLEVGVFTGYSSLSVALAMPPDGRIVACDRSEEWTSTARRYWKEARVDEKIELRVGPATQTLDALLAGGARGTFDFVFVDADKEAALDYYERSLELLRKGGLFGFDNALWEGRVADPREQSPSTLAVRALNERASSDPRVSATLVPIGDGLLLATKR
ncbi:MAG TPA: class I SAM-dependent methyltransferase [Polyangiaceae bacterium]